MTVICACLFASKPVVMRLIPDKLIANVKSRSGSWSSHRPNLFLNHGSRQSKDTLESDENTRLPESLTAQRSTDQAVRYEMEHYNSSSPGAHTFFDSSEAKKELGSTGTRGACAV